MLQYSATLRIQASPEVLWQLLTDAAGYPQWDPWVERIEGQIAPGQRVKAYTKLQPGRAFPATVTEFVPGQKMVWTGGMPFGLFTGVRTFTLTPQGAGVTEFTLTETFTGLLLPLFARSIPDMNPVFRDFAEGLKAFAENP